MDPGVEVLSGHRHLRSYTRNNSVNMTLNRY